MCLGGHTYAASSAAGAQCAYEAIHLCIRPGVDLMVGERQSRDGPVAGQLRHRREYAGRTRATHRAEEAETTAAKWMLLKPAAHRA